MIRRRKDGLLVYALRFRAYGRRRCVTLGTSEEGWTRAKAAEELQNVLADVRRGLWAPPRRGAGEQAASKQVEDPTFHEFAADWFKARRNEWRPSTRADYEWQLELHLLPYFAEHRLSEITVAEVDRYKATKVEAGKLSATSINKTLTRLAQIMDVAVEYGLIEKNPARGRGRRVKAAVPTRTYIDRADQIESLLDAAGQLDLHGRGPKLRRPLLATLAFAGLRLGEALDLRCGSVDLASGTLRVADSKTPAGIREVELLPALRDELSTYKAGRRELSATDFVFATASGARQNQANVRNRMLARSIEIANQIRNKEGRSELPSGLTPHSLRRTYISLTLAIGEEVPFVMQQVGHVDPKVTLGIYARVMFRKDGERERLKALVTGNSTAVADVTADPALRGR